MAPPISMNLATSFTHSPVCSVDSSMKPKSQPGSVAAARAKLYAQGLGAPRGEVSIYKGVSDRPLGWKRRKSTKRASLARELDFEAQRWDGRCRMASPWDVVKRVSIHSVQGTSTVDSDNEIKQDQELWYTNGDCLIHLYAAGSSRRGPAFRIPFDCLLRSDCGRLLTENLTGYGSTTSSPTSSSSFDASYFSLPLIPQNGRYDLYIPAPPSPSLSNRNSSLRHLIRTRNFFAWLCGKPLVGENLGNALVNLLQNMIEWRSDDVDNLDDLRQYMDEMCYNDMSDAPEHAIAMLILAENLKDELLWAEAFGHVVGMWDACFECAGYTALSRDTRSLITRAQYSLSLRLHHVSASMATFLDDQLSPAHISLSTQNLGHLARFRDFLHTYWMSVTGYYPPLSDSDTSSSILGFASEYNFSKSLLYQMIKQFQALHDYLVNTHFSPQDPSPNGAMGGLCVLQSVQAFDFCHNYKSLSHPLPHLPEPPKVAKGTRSLSSLMGKKDKLHVDPRLASLSTLNKASNVGKPDLLQSSLVKAFRLFEKQSVFADAKKKEKKGKKFEDQEVEKRKVRWILVYAIVQMLRTVTEVDHPMEEVDGSVEYFLCAKVPRVPWHVASPVLTPERKTSLSAATLMHTPSNSSSMTHTLSTGHQVTSTRTAMAESSRTEEKVFSIEPDIDHVAISRRNSHATSDPPSPIAKAIGFQPAHHRSTLSLSFPIHTPSRPILKLRTKSLPTSAALHVTPISPLRSKGTVKRALSSLGNMPKLQQPKPLRPNSAVEILVGGYGNGLSDVSIGWENQEELHNLKRRSTSSGESFYDDDHQRTIDAADDEKCFSDDHSIYDHVQSPLCPAHGYEDCLSSEWSESGDSISLSSPSTSTTTSLSRCASGSSQEKALPRSEERRVGKECPV